MSELCGAETMLSFVPEPTYAPDSGLLAGAPDCDASVFDAAASGSGSCLSSGALSVCSGVLVRSVMERVKPSSVFSSRTPTFRIR